MEHKFEDRVVYLSEQADIIRLIQEINLRLQR